MGGYRDGDVRSKTVHAPGVVVKQLPLIGLRHAFHQFEEGLIDAIEARVDLVDREIRREHAAVNPENFDGRKDEWPDAGNRPVRIDHSQPRDLGVDIRVCSKRLHAVMPRLNASWITVQRHAGVVQYDGRPLMGPRHLRRIWHLVRIELKIKGKGILLQEIKAVQPLGIRQQIVSFDKAVL